MARDNWRAVQPYMGCFINCNNCCTGVVILQVHTDKIKSIVQNSKSVMYITCT